MYRCDSAVQGEIEEFLGQDICQYPMVRDSILTQEEKINLDKELKIVELDNALEHANGKSAPGVDGFTYGFIRKFWHIYFNVRPYEGIYFHILFDSLNCTANVM